MCDGPFTGRQNWKASNNTRERYKPVRRQNLAETDMGSYYNYPVDTRRRFNVYKTSRRLDVLQTLKRRRVSTGYEKQ